MNEITQGSALREKIESRRYDTFTFPILDITIKYRKPDLLKLSLNKSLPLAMASAIISAYKEAVGGADMEEYAKEAANQKFNADDAMIKDLSEKGYTLLQELSESHVFLDVQQSDFEAQPKAVIAWKDVPEEDAIAFLLNLIQKAQVGKTKSGGEVSAEDITSFSDGKRSAKRSTTRSNGQAIRQSAQ